jgi:hypothetical protein
VGVLVEECVEVHVEVLSVLLKLFDHPRNRDGVRVLGKQVDRSSVFAAAAGLLGISRWFLALAFEGVAVEFDDLHDTILHRSKQVVLANQLEGTGLPQLEEIRQSFTELPGHDEAARNI